MFWKTYIQESLGVDWVLGPQKKSKSQGPLEAIPILDKTWIFVTTSVEKKPQLKNMMERMIVAVGKEPDEIFCLSSQNRTYISRTLETLSHEQKAIVFGNELLDMQEPMGTWFTKGQGQLMWTHSLQSLKDRPSLKKETWTHLQKFVSFF